MTTTTETTMDTGAERWPSARQRFGVAFRIAPILTLGIGADGM
jgi:hypothetical protein